MLVPNIGSLKSQSMYNPEGQLPHLMGTIKLAHLGATVISCPFNLRTSKGTLIKPRLRPLVFFFFPRHVLINQNEALEFVVQIRLFPLNLDLIRGRFPFFQKTKLAGEKKQQF